MTENNAENSSELTPELTLEQQATNAATWQHINRVRELLNVCMKSLLEQGEAHDQSKLQSPEVEVFTEYTAKLKDLTYGSEEYKACLAAMKPALDHHYANNPHHPEFFEYWKCPACSRMYWRDDVPDTAYPAVDYPHAGSSPDLALRWCLDCYGGKYPGFFETALIHHPHAVEHMNLLEITEMICDWLAASERHADGDIYRSIEINTKRFNLSPQLAQILANTVKYLKCHS